MAHEATLTISILLGPKTKQSRLVPEVHRVFGWPAPVAGEIVDDELRSLWAELTEEQRAVVLGLARAFKKS
jgi:hypothetical protein